MPTYDEAENIGPITTAILEQLPDATILVVDDNSPDGTGQRADELAAADPRIRVKHRARKQGLGRAYIDGFRTAVEGGADRIVQMDADWSHDPGYLPDLVWALRSDERPDGADLVIGSRYVAGRRRQGLGLHAPLRLARRLAVRANASCGSSRTT